MKKNQTIFLKHALWKKKNANQPKKDYDMDFWNMTYLLSHSKVPKKIWNFFLTNFLYLCSFFYNISYTKSQ